MARGALRDYLFILGRKPTLSIAELCSYLADNNLDYSPLKPNSDLALMRIEEDFEPERVILDLGGSSKIGEIIDEHLFGTNWQDIIRNTLSLDNLLNNYLLNRTKVNFGFSSYTLNSSIDIRTLSKFTRALGSEIKQGLKARGINSKFIGAGVKHLPTKFVAEKLLDQGAEITIVVDEKRIYFAKTLAVQDYKGYHKRDYERPKRTPEVGILPPRVAQIMLNLLAPNDISEIYDPFCGCGTILQEALLRGKNVKGSDLSLEEVEATKDNLNWLLKQEDIINSREDIGAIGDIFISDAREISKHLPPASIEAVVTEGYLGPLADSLATDEISMRKLVTKMRELYISFFSELRKVLKDEGRIVISFPYYRISVGRQTPQSELNSILISDLSLDIVDDITSLGYKYEKPFPPNIANFSVCKVTPQGGLLYDREDKEAIVCREIFIFTKCYSSGALKMGS